ncbi:MAG TPA: hypothetical protein IGS37_17280 [Synechococcales cyanobacterium M55_K2018_004]|nr:hypothetical protein [Synechococcales cyanobacterium M55_K2018_004]
MSPQPRQPARPSAITTASKYWATKLYSFFPRVTNFSGRFTPIPAAMLIAAGIGASG